MLSEIIARGDLAGLLSISTIICIVIALICLKDGLISGGLWCFCLYLIACFFTGYWSWSVCSDYNYISNRDQTKWILQSECDIDHDWHNEVGGEGSYLAGTSFEYNGQIEIIPSSYLIDSSGSSNILKSTGKVAESSDYYIYNKVYNKINVPRSAGGYGIPTWVYCCDAPISVFGLVALCYVGLGVLISSLIRR